MINRLKQVIEYSGMNVATFARECNIPYMSLYSCLIKRRGVSVDIVQKILQRYPEVEEGWLLLNRGEMLSQKTRAAIERKK